jgi:hypothetical protein
MAFWLAKILKQNNLQWHSCFGLCRGVWSYAPTVQFARNGMSDNFTNITKNRRRYLGKQEYLCC